MNIHITDTFRISVDEFGKHQPEYIKVIAKDRWTGWVSSGVVCNNVAGAVQWGIENGHIDPDCILYGSDDLTIGDYLGILNKNMMRWNLSATR